MAPPVWSVDGTMVFLSGSGPPHNHEDVPRSVCVHIHIRLYKGVVFFPGLERRLFLGLPTACASKSGDCSTVTACTRTIWKPGPNQKESVFLIYLRFLYITNPGHPCSSHDVAGSPSGSSSTTKASEPIVVCLGCTGKNGSLSCWDWLSRLSTRLCSRLFVREVTRASRTARATRSRLTDRDMTCLQPNRFLFLIVMASDLKAMASNLIAMASNRIAMASNRIASWKGV